MSRRRALAYLACVTVVGAYVPTPLRATGAVDRSGVEQGSTAGRAQLVRTVSYKRGRRLDSLLRPSDEVLEVIDEQPYGLPPPPPPPGYPGHGKPELQRRVEATPFIALVRITRLEGSLTRAGDWVRTTVHGEVRHVYKARSEASLADGTVTLMARGGEVRVGRQRIRARHHSASFLEREAEYLVFALPAESGSPSSTGALDTGAWYRVDGDDLISVATGYRQASAAMLADITKYVVAEGR